MFKILFLEDEPELAQIYKEELEISGFEVLWIESLNGLEEKIKKFQADIFVFDQEIRGESKTGIEILHELKNNFPHSKSIILSNYSNPNLEKKAKQAGANKFLLKINTPPKLLVTHIQKLLNER